MRPTILVAIPIIIAGALGAQPVDYLYRKVPVTGVDSGYLDNPTRTSRVVWEGRVRVPGAASLRLYFEQTNLAQGSSLRLTSMHDEAVQYFDARSLAEYQDLSAWFNGEEVKVELVAGARSARNRAKVVAADAGQGVIIGPSTICGPTDDRVRSFDPRQGRQHPTGCTSWLINKTTVITAGHCTSTPTQEVHFNVPLSTPGGSIVLPPPKDQYRYDTRTLRRLNAGVGADWAVAATLRNSTTGLYPGQAQGDAYELANPPPFNRNESIRITGYGVTSPRNQLSQVQKTHVGPWVSLNARPSAVGYKTDTSGGNSGSPVVHEQTGLAIGVHTHGGCTSFNTGNNWGTAYNRADWAAAVAAVKDLKAAGCYEPFGSGCGNGGVPELGNDGFPDLGATMTAAVSKALPNSSGLMFFGVAEQQPPIDLGIINMQGCSLYVTIDAAFPITTDANGDGGFQFTVPRVLQLVRANFFNQAAISDSRANPLGVAMTNAAKATIGD